jgi:hypothetical protein
VKLIPQMNKAQVAAINRELLPESNHKLQIEDNNYEKI